MRKKQIGRRAGRALALCLGVACISCGSTDSSKGSSNAIKLGMLAPKSGELAGWGKQMEGSALFAIKEINDAGGVLGRPLTLIVEDTQADEATAVTAAKKLLDEGVVAIIGPGTSAEAVAVVEQVTRKAGVPMISPGATSPQLTDMDDGDTFFRTIASDAFQGKVLAKRMRDDKIDKVAIIHRDDAYGDGLRDSVKSSFTELGGQMGEIVSYDQNKLMNFSTEVGKLLPSGALPDAVVLIAYHEDGANVTRDIQGLGLAKLPRFYSVDAADSDEFAKAAAPNVVNGLVGTAGTSPTDSPNYIKVSKAFGALTNSPDDFDSGTYDAVGITALAFAAAGDTSPALVIKNLRQVTRADGSGATVINAEDWKKGFEAAAAGKDVDYEGASGPVELDEHGDTSRGFFVFWDIAVKDGVASVETQGGAVEFP